MKQMRKKLLAMIMAMMSFVLLGTACGSGGGDDSVKDEYKNRANQLDVMVFNGGYGYQWLKDVANYYMDNVDTNTFVNIVPTVMNGTELSKIQAGLATYDVYLLDGGLDGAADVLTDLSDVMASYPTGETEYTIEEKMSDIASFYKKINGKYYVMPWMSSLGFSFMYNKTSIDNALGAGSWTLPRTTVEFFELGDRLLSNGMYLYSAAYGDQYDYLHYGQQVWLAQAMGWEAYEKYFSGYYKDGDEWKFASDFPYMISQNEENIKSYYKVLYDLALPGNNYIHANSNVMSFTDIEAVFAGYGYGRNPAKTAFIFEGPWGESEVNYVCKTIDGEPCKDTVGAMKMPINSQITARLSSVNDEATLRAVIDYVDGNGSKPAGVTDEDIAAVAEARRMVGQFMSTKMMIPSTCKKVALAKEFIKFLASDVAQSITMDSMNGINLLPFDSKTTVTGTKPLSTYVKTFKEVAKDAIYISLYNDNYMFAKVTGFNAYVNTPTIANGIASMANASMVQTPQAFYNQLFNTYKNQWSNMISRYNAYIGN